MIKKSSTKKSKKSNVISTLNFDLKKITPMTENQKKVFDLYDEGKNLVLYGSAGTGKTLLPTFLGINDIIEYGTYEKIIFIRNNESTKECGFLPGDIKQKFEVFDKAFKAQVNFLFNRDDAWDILIKKGIVIFENTSFLRGLTFEKSLIIADECQNFTLHEFSTIITRLDPNSRIFFCGDYNQTDLDPKRNISGMDSFLKITSMMKEFGHVKFTLDDIVRSDIVKSYLVAKEKLGL